MTDNMEIGFLFKNYAKVHSEGKLKLANSFVLEYGSSLPEKLYIELPSREVWYGKYVKKSYYIEGLENMISFYGVRPYHMVVFHYSGGPYFKLKVFNECGVEIFYPFSCPSSSKFRVRRNDPFVVVGRMKLTDIEIDKLAATFSFNTLHNFLGLHDVIIQRSHLTEASQYEVMSCIEFQKLGMDEGMNVIELCFEHYWWTIRMLQKNGVLFFDKGWYEFVKAANICEGDVCVIQRTAAVGRFKIAVLPKHLLTQWSSTADNRIGDQRFSWFKILKGSCLETGIVEVPRLFAMRLGRELGTQIHFITTDGRVFTGKYSFSNNKISGLMDMITAYDIYHNCIIVFEYVGNSTFHVSIFDSLNMDHLKDINGEFIADIVKELEMNELQISNANEDQTEVLDGVLPRHEKDDVIVIDEVYDHFGVEGNENEANEIAFGNDNNAFVIKLKKSYFDGKGRGAYCSTQLHHIYKNWNSSTIVKLHFRGEVFEVLVHRNNRSCRFAKGWDEFVRKAELHEGELLEFRFLHGYNVEVLKIR